MLSILYRNIAYGPYEGGGWHEDICSELLALATLLNENDKSLLSFWPRIVDDLRGTKWELPDNAEGRRKFISMLPSCPLLRQKFTRVSTKRWMSYKENSKGSDPWHHTKGMIMSTVCLNKGVEYCIENLETPLVREDLAHVAHVTAAAGASSSSATAKESRAKSVAEGKRRMEAARAKGKNTLHAATKLILNEDLTRSVRIIDHITHAEYLAYKKDVDMFTVEDSCAQRLRYNAQWGWLGELVGAVGSLHDLDGLRRCGFVVDFKMTKGSSRSLVRASSRRRVRCASRQPSHQADREQSPHDALVHLLIPRLAGQPH